MKVLTLLLAATALVAVLAEQPQPAEQALDAKSLLAELMRKTKPAPKPDYKPKNTPPKAKCVDRWYEADKMCQKTVYVNVDSGSFDEQDRRTGLTLKYEPDHSVYGLGKHKVKLTVKDRANMEDHCYGHIIVKDKMAPWIKLQLGKKVLYETCKYEDVCLKYSAKDNCDDDVDVDLSVWSTADNEDDEEPDAIFEQGKLKLRASSCKYGRIYLVKAKAEDEAGNYAVKCKAVIVPPSKKEADAKELWEEAEKALYYCNAAGKAPKGYYQLYPAEEEKEAPRKKKAYGDD